MRRIINRIWSKFNIKNKEGYTARDYIKYIKKGPMNRRIKKLEDLQIKGFFRYN
ncbi:MAG: hypothetical protein ISN64_00555 [Rickettsia sp.]|nr:hypothetical protein [Rickettsia sp.]